MGRAALNFSIRSSSPPSAHVARSVSDGNDVGDTILHASVRYRHVQPITILASRLDELEVEHKNAANETPLELARRLTSDGDATSKTVCAHLEGIYREYSIQLQERVVSFLSTNQSLPRVLVELVSAFLARQKHP